MKIIPKRSIAVMAALATGCAGAIAGPVGVATEAMDNTVGSSIGSRHRLVVGTQVSLNETLETDNEGRARIQFIDQTLLSMGPRSRITVDRYVAGDAGGARALALNAARGAFRFASGISGSKAYNIVTPVATIGVRGTRFAFTVSNARVSVSVEEGRVIVCVKGSQNCRSAGAGQTISLTGQRFALSNSLIDTGGLAPALGSTLGDLGRGIGGLLAPATAAPLLNSPAGGLPAGNTPSLPGGGGGGVLPNLRGGGLPNLPGGGGGLGGLGGRR